MAIYTESQFIELYSDPSAKLTQLRAIIDALDTLQLDMIGKGAIKSYMLHDGQVEIRRAYGSLKEIQDTRLAYVQEAHRIIAQMQGRSTNIIHSC